MRKFFFLCIVLFLFSCNENKSSKTNEIISTSDNDQFNWLLGKWERMNQEDGKYNTEKWDIEANGDYVGFAYTIQKGDTISSEDMKIARVGNHWVLDVMSKGDTIPTSFNMTTSTKTSFTFENLEIEFPNEIHYILDGKHLKATISNDDMQILFEFEKM